MATVLTEATQYSPTISALVDCIAGSNVIAHVECRHRTSLTVEGRTVFVLATHGVRYVRVQVDCLHMRRELIAIIGHELQHVVESVSASPKNSGAKTDAAKPLSGTAGQNAS
jgi:hypothetical protein